MTTRILVLICFLLFDPFPGLAQKNDNRTDKENQIYRIKHLQLEMSSWNEYPIVESVPRVYGSLDSLQIFLSQYIPTEKESGQIYLRFPFKFIVQRDGTITDVESLARKRQDIADSLMNGIRKLPGWIPGRVRNQPVRTVVVMTATLSGENFSLEIPTAENGSRLPRTNVPFTGRWIQYRKDTGTTDTLRLTRTTYYMKSFRPREETRVFAKIIGHNQDSSHVTLQYEHYFINTREIQPRSKFFYLTYACTQKILYTTQSDSTYPNRNLLEYNATCNVWEKRK